MNKWLNIFLVSVLTVMFSTLSGCSSPSSGNETCENIYRIRCYSHGSEVGYYKTVCHHRLTWLYGEGVEFWLADGNYARCQTDYIIDTYK